MKVSLEQWAALVSVVESGGYAKAGERLHKSQSTLTYAIQKLEDVLGVKAFEIRGRMAVEIVFPTWLLLECMAEFGRERPETRIELHETVLGGNEEMLAQRKVDLAIGPVVPPGFLGDALMRVELICLAAPSHPLHA